MPEDTPPPPAGGDGSPSHPSLDQLRAFLDGELPTSMEQEVVDHLESCPTCVDRLGELEGTAVLARVPELDPGAWDERRMRRSVRRTVLRTAVNAAALLVLVALTLQVLGLLVVHPVLVDRGGRVSASLMASIDLPVMTTPGLEPVAVDSHPGVLRRTTEVGLQRAVGARMVALGSFTTRLGPLGITAPGGMLPFGPQLHGGPHRTTDGSRVPFAPDRLGEATAVTVELIWSDPISLAAADAVDDATGEVALLWVGFDVGGEPNDPWRLGYSACTAIPEQATGPAGSGFGMAGFRTPGQDTPVGSRHALAQLRRALDNLADTGWFQDPGGPTAIVNAAEAAERLADTPGVTSVVLTGPTQLVAEAVAASGPDSASLLEVDFDRGAPEPCG